MPFSLLLHKFLVAKLQHPRLQWKINMLEEVKSDTFAYERKKTFEVYVIFNSVMDIYTSFNMKFYLL
jgi:hypothetical protein